MFIVLLNYIQPLAAVDALVAEHREFLQRHYAAGHFVLSGRLEPRTGGVILANVASREELVDILRADPFQRDGVAEYQIIEFVPSMAAPHLTMLLPS